MLLRRAATQTTQRATPCLGGVGSVPSGSGSNAAAADLPRRDVHRACKQATKTGRASSIPASLTQKIETRRSLSGFLRSGREDSNFRPLDPQSSALTRLRYAPSRSHNERLRKLPQRAGNASLERVAKEILGGRGMRSLRPSTSPAQLMGLDGVQRAARSPWTIDEPDAVGRVHQTALRPEPL